MIDVQGLRQQINSRDMIDGIDLHANLRSTISELLDRFEAAEKECSALRTDKATLQQMTYSLKDRLEVAERDRATFVTEIGNLRTKVEAAERERYDVAQQLVQAEIGKRKLDAECDALHAEDDTRKALIDLLRAEIDRLRAKIAAMEKQEPHSYIYRYWDPLDGSPVWRHESGNWNGQQPGACAPLYALPGAKGE